jgi:hypothetical protein
MKNVLLILASLIFSFFAANGQNKINFNNKKISELGVSMGGMKWVEEFRPTFPYIWRDFDPDSDDYSFSGFYTLDIKSDNETKILNGLVKLIRLQIQVAEGTLNIKEELTFNFINGDMSGPINYSQYSSENNGETNESELHNAKWKKEVSISANYMLPEGKYINISFSETRDWEKTKYIISQGVGYDISIDYFNTIISINTAMKNEKPIFNKIKY